MDGTAMPGRRIPAELRFEALVDKSGDCWVWKGYKLPNGYPRFSFQGKAVYAHHFSWSNAHGEWPTKILTHACGFVGCVNPEHLMESRPK